MQDFDPRWGEWPDDGDPIGTASARLLALGVERTRRLAVLRFLGILLDHAGLDGVVRVDVGTLAGEFRLERADVRAHVTALERAGILTEEPAGLRVAGFANHGATGLPEGEAMALIASVLGSPAPGTPGRRSLDELWLDDAPVVTEAPSLAEHDAPTLVGAAGNRVRAGFRQPVGAALALITGLVLVVAAVFAQPASDRSELSEVAVGRPATTESIPTTVDGTPGTSGEAEPVTPVGTAPGPTLPGTSIAPGSTTVPVAAVPGQDAPVAVEGACPAQVPAVSDVVAEVEPADLSAVVASSPWVVSVEGLLVAGAETASVTSIPVVVHFSDGSEVTGEALAAPVLLEPGRAVRWQTTIDAGATTVPDVSSVSAGAPVWQWAEPGLAGTCPGS